MFALLRADRPGEPEKFVGQPGLLGRRVVERRLHLLEHQQEVEDLDVVGPRVLARRDGRTCPAADQPPDSDGRAPAERRAQRLRPRAAGHAIVTGRRVTGCRRSAFPRGPRPARARRRGGRRARRAAGSAVRTTAAPRSPCPSHVTASSVIAKPFASLRSAAFASGVCSGGDEPGRSTRGEEPPVLDSVLVHDERLEARAPAARRPPDLADGPPPDRGGARAPSLDVTGVSLEAWARGMGDTRVPWCLRGSGRDRRLGGRRRALFPSR